MDEYCERHRTTKALSGFADRAEGVFKPIAAAAERAIPLVVRSLLTVGSRDIFSVKSVEEHVGTSIRAMTEYQRRQGMKAWAAVGMALA